MFERTVAQIFGLQITAVFQLFSMDHIELSSPPVLNLELHVSNPAHAQQFAQVFGTYIHIFQDRRTRSSSERTSGYRKSSEKSNIQQDENPHDVLNIRPGATKEEIVAAYRRMVQMYHPDKVAGLAPEFREIAEERMRAINAAYEKLKATFVA
jgi:DnaJ-domain-containing protein 1